MITGLVADCVKAVVMSERAYYTAVPSSAKVAESIFGCYGMAAMRCVSAQVETLTSDFFFANTW